MKELMTTQLPNEETLKHLAAGADVKQVIDLLDSLQTSPLAGELATRVDTLGLRLDVLDLFSNARTGLDELYQKRPNSAIKQSEPKIVPVETLAAEAQAYGLSIGEYLEILRNGKETVLRDPGENEKPGILSLKSRLINETTRQPALDKLRKLSDVTPEWLKERTNDTVQAVTEKLWEVTSTGRDVAALYPTLANDQAEMARMVTIWATTVDEEFQGSADQLAGAITWLEGDT